VVRNDDLMFQTAVVQPTVDFDRMELVLVITGFPPEAASPDAPLPQTTPEAQTP